MLKFESRTALVAATFAIITGASVAAAQQPMRSADSVQMRMTMLPEPRGISMDRTASGTSWIPDAIMVPSTHASAGSWDLMLQGFAFGQYDAQSGARGGSQLGSLNWGMVTASHALAGGRFQGRTMLSLDAATVTSQGYPLLLQTGEMYHGEPLHDRQHPHDLFMEVGALYERDIDWAGISLYAAPSGEPALGPVAFMHRPSAMDNPFAPLGHHWQDASHVSFGVVTAGLFAHQLKLEGSVFNGRDPDENRWDFDFHPLDSYSGRLAFNPDSSWSVSASYGFLKSPEPDNPGHTMHRMTLVAQYGRALRSDGQIAAMLLWGGMRHSDEPGLSHSVLAESEAVLDASNTLIGRIEYVQKTADDLVLDPSLALAPNRRFDISAVSLGYIREIGHWGASTWGLGVMGTANLIPSTLEPAYGSRTPVGAVILLRLRPSLLRGAMGGMSGMRMME